MPTDAGWNAFRRLLPVGRRRPDARAACPAPNPSAAKAAQTRGRAAVASGLLILAVGCSTGSASQPGTKEATATTFTTERAVVSGLRSMAADATGSSLFAASGAGGPQASDCAATWRGIRDRVARRDARAASTLDAAVSQLEITASQRDAAGASAAAATITKTGADYSRQYP